MPPLTGADSFFSKLSQLFFTVSDDLQLLNVDFLYKCWA